MSLLTARGLTVRERRTGGVLVDNLDFDLRPGSCLGVVGESGSGKTLSCRALLGLLPPALAAEGSAILAGASRPGSPSGESVDLLKIDPETLRRIRGRRIALIVQQPMTAFDPLCTLGAQFLETLRAHTEDTDRQARTAALDMLRAVRIRDPEEVFDKYPHQLSGGMLQRCLIAIALALRPDIIIADEPTTALDAVSQRDVVEQLIRIREERGTAMLFVSHDLGVVQALAQTLVVMKDGRCVEHGPADTVLHAPEHPYTRYLIRTRLSLTRAFQEALRRPAAGETDDGPSPDAGALLPDSGPAATKTSGWPPRFPAALRRRFA